MPTQVTAMQTLALLFLVQFREHTEEEHKNKNLIRMYNGCCFY